MALQTEEGALHFPTWGGLGRMQRAKEVGVEGHCKQGEVPKQKRCHGKTPGVFWEQRGVQSNYKTLWEKSEAKWPKCLNTKLRNWDLIPAADEASASLLVAERSHAYGTVEEYT